MCLRVLFALEQTMYLWPGVVQMKGCDFFHLGQCGHGRPWHGIRVWFLFRHTLTAAALQMIGVARSPYPLPLRSHTDFLLQSYNQIQIYFRLKTSVYCVLSKEIFVINNCTNKVMFTILQIVFYCILFIYLCIIRTVNLFTILIKILIQYAA